MKAISRSRSTLALKVTTQGPVAHAAEAGGLLESIVLEFKIVPEFKYR